MRKSKLAVAMEAAIVYSQRSHDAQTKVGAVLIKNDTGSHIASGFNGYVRGAPDGELPDTRPDKYEYIRHAEENIITNCARHGISTDNCTLVCTLTPCARCMRLLYQAGITRVIARDEYHDWNHILNMKDLTILHGRTSDGFIELIYKEK